MKNATAIAILCILSAFAFAGDPLPASRRGVLVLDGRQYRYNPPEAGRTKEVPVPGRGVYVVDAAGAVVTNSPPPPPRELTEEQKARMREARERALRGRAKKGRVSAPKAAK